ncbi:MAG: sugar ABC transporter permease [Eubacteriales bacterium]
MDSKGRKRYGLLMLLPAILMMLVFIAYPVLNTIADSLTNARMQTSTVEFVGLDNYISLISDPVAIAALKFTVLFTVTATSLEAIIGMTLALIMRRTFKGQGAVRAIILIPWTIPTIVLGMMWQFMFAESHGIINHMLLSTGAISEAIPWLTKANWSFLAILIADAWKTSPYMSLMLLSGLQTIPSEMYEAGSIDGANAVQKFVKITLPMMKPVLMVALLFRTVQSFRIYDLVVALTNGGPANSTQSMTMYTIKTYFTFGNTGYGAALAISTFLVSLCIAFLFLDGMKERMGTGK